MSYFKKISLLALSLIAIISLAQVAVVSAQSGRDATPEEMEVLNSLPEVFVTDVILEKNDYKAGDTVKGYFTLINSKDISVSNLSYQATLVGDLMADSLYKNAFDNKILGSVFLNSSETKKVYFEYPLPLSSNAYTFGKQLGIEIRAFSGSGIPLGWGDTKVNISDSGIAPVLINYASIIVNGEAFGLNEGPMVYGGEKVTLKMTANNESIKDILNLTPRISIYEMNYASKPLMVYSEEEFSLNAKGKLDFNFDLPTFDYTPKVYAGEIAIVDASGVNRISPIKFRYIVYGEVVNIHNVTIDKVAAKSGEKVNVKIDYTGAPYDITNLVSATATPSDFSLKLFNEKDELVGKYSDKTIFVTLGSRDINLVLNKEARAFKVEILVSKNGKVITEYKTTLSAENIDQIKDEPLAVDQKMRNIIYISLLVLILIIVGIVLLVLRKRKGVVISIALIILGLGMVTNKVEASYGTTNRSNPSVVISMSSPSKFYFTPGENFRLAGTVSAMVCGNSFGYNITMMASNILSNWGSSTRTNWYEDLGHNPVLVQGTKINTVSTGFKNTYGTTQYSVYPTFSFNYIAPQEPGTYRIYFAATNQWSTAAFADTVKYFEFTVGPAPVLTASCNSATSANVVFTPAGATRYWLQSATSIANLEKSIYRFSLLLTSAMGNTYLDNALSANTTYYYRGWLDGGSGWSSPFSTSVNCPTPSALLVTCSVNPPTAPLGQTVTWTAVATGGTGTYTYAWTGTGFVDGKTTAVVSGVYPNPTPNPKLGTVVVTSGAENVTVACSGTVNSGGGSGSGGGGGGHTLETCSDGILNNGETKPDCGGINCPACPSPSPSGGSLNCSVVMNPVYNPNAVNINTSTGWDVISPDGSLITDKIKKWYVQNGTEGAVEVSDVDATDNRLDTILTTIGLKTISVSIASTTNPSIFNDCQNTATTTVVRTGGSIREI